MHPGAQEHRSWRQSTQKQVLRANAQVNQLGRLLLPCSGETLNRSCNVSGCLRCEKKTDHIPSKMPVQGWRGGLVGKITDGSFKGPGFSS